MLGHVANGSTANAQPNSVYSPQLVKAAEWTAYHGGIKCSRHKCATSKMKWLSKQLVIDRFKSAGSYAVRVALCIVKRESGFNPGAINEMTGQDHGLFQINRPTHPQYNYYLLDHDPVYQVNVAWGMSQHGRNWSPWYSKRNPCY